MAFPIQNWNPALLAQLAAPNLQFSQARDQMATNAAQREKMLAELAYMPVQQENEKLKTLAWLAQSGYTIDPATGELAELPGSKGNLDNLMKSLQMQNLMGQIQEREQKGVFVPAGGTALPSLDNSDVGNFVPGQPNPASGMIPPAPQVPAQGAMPTFVNSLNEKIDSGAEQGGLALPVINETDTQELTPPPVITQGKKKAPMEDYAAKLSMYENATPGMLNNAPMMRLGDGRILTQAQYDKELTKAQKEGKYYTGIVTKVENIIPMIDDAIKQIEESDWGATKIAVRYKDDPLSPAYRLDKMLDGVRSNLGIDNITKMRQESPTGGALGSVSDKDINLVQSTKGTLDIGAGKDEILKSLKRTRKGYEEIGKEVGVDVEKLGQSGQEAQAGSSIPEGATATNPRTGEKVIFKGGAWQPL